MHTIQTDELFHLSEVEVETMRRAAVERNLPFDPNRLTYKASELEAYGMVREAYNSEELKAKGVSRNRIVTCFDTDTVDAREQLVVDAPFADKIHKWQLPIDVCEWRILMAEFPPASFVEPHVHAANTPEQPGGSLRTVLKGSITYAGRRYDPGDWFFIPNGIPYSFKTDENDKTVVMYKYAFFAVAQGNRFSHPIELDRYRIPQTSVA